MFDNSLRCIEMPWVFTIRMETKKTIPATLISKEKNQKDRERRARQV